MPTKLSPKCLSWASILDGKAAAQAALTASMPFVYPHLALMPDAHLGKGATVGSVIPTKGALMPAAVGVDIGCGMYALRAGIHVSEITPDVAREIRLRVEGVIQLGHGAADGRHIPDPARVSLLEEKATDLGVDPASYYGGWVGQLGSLGGGNHFIELVADQDDDVWLFLHSGSRGVGNKIANYWIKRAQAWCERAHIQLPGGDRDLAYLIDDDLWAYWRAMQWAQSYAYENRAEMMDRFVQAVAEAIGRPFTVNQHIRCHHNYTRRERHFGQDLFVTRKGAIDAHEGVFGLIPGSMGAASYVVRGKGNRSAVCSAPHGAGRNHSRAQARKVLDFDEQAAIVNARGTEWSGSRSFHDEMPDAYKPIDQVMADSVDLVDVVHEFRALVNVKGA